MKIYPNQLAFHLKQHQLPIYLISGDEPLLVQEATTVIVNHYKKLEYTEHLRFTQEPNFNWESLLFAANHLSLFDDKRILELKLTNLKIGTGEKILLNYVANPPADNLLIIVAPKLDANIQRTKWFKALEEKSGVVQIWPLENKQIQQWLQERLKIYNLSSDPIGIDFLITFTQGNLLALNQELEKLSLIYPTGKLTLEQIVTTITDNSRFSVFDLLDYALAGKTAETLRAMRHLKQEGLEPAIILWAIAKELRILIDCANSSNLEQTLQKIMWKRQPLLKYALTKNPLVKLHQMLKHAATIDLYIKGVKSANVWNELTQLYLKLAGAT